MKNAMQLKAIMKKLAKENQISAQLVLAKLYAGTILGAGIIYPRIGIITSSKVAF